MKNKSNDMTQRLDKQPSQFTEILWWFSTVVKEIISDCISDRNKYKIIGGAVMFTWLYATLAWTYFWSTNTNNPFVFILLGVFMGAFVLAIDRVLISSINKGRNNIFAIALRIIMALCIGGFLSQPLILFIYSSDINREIPLLLDKKKVEKKKEIEKIFEIRKNELIKENSKIESEILKKKEEMDDKNKEYLKEIDGTGGSGNYGIAGIADAKKKVFNSAVESFEELSKSKKNDIEKVNNELDDINNNINTKFKEYEDNLTSDGYLIRKESLQSLLDKDKTNSLRNDYYLLMIILTLFELIPIVSKLFLSSSSYDSKIEQRDNLEININEINTTKEFELKEAYNETAKIADINLIKQLFSEVHPERSKKTNQIIENWKTEGNTSFDELWSKFKEEILSKQEN